MEWIFAQNIAEALASANEGSRYVGGGLSLTLLREHGVDTPTRLIDLSALPLQRIEGRQGELRLGAQVKIADLARDPMVQTLAPLLRESAAQTATPAIRNQSTLGGELLARTRCPLFRDANNLRCSKRIPHSGCALQEGVHASFAVLGGSPACIAPSSSELAVALGALSAQATLLSQSGTKERAVPLLDLYLAPGETPEREFALEPGELLTSVTIPVQTARRYGYAKIALSPLHPVASAAVMLEQRGDVIASARVVLGGLTTRPWRSQQSESVLIGQSPNAALFAKAAAVALTDAAKSAGSRAIVDAGKQVIEIALQRVGDSHGR